MSHDDDNDDSNGIQCDVNASNHSFSNEEAEAEAFQSTRTTRKVLSDSFLIEHVLPEELRERAFKLVQEEIEWSDMYHKGGPVPRKVAIQGDVMHQSMIGNRGSVHDWKNTASITDNMANMAIIQPIYRHPAADQPALQHWTPTVRSLRDLVQKIAGQPINHALIQIYRNGNDYISEHADKTLDVARNSIIFSLSLGATRTMFLRGKREQSNGVKTSMPRIATRVPLHHGSLFGLGWKTNQTMTHEIKRDKRQARDKTDQELEYNGRRISITFRHIATFIMHVPNVTWTKSIANTQSRSHNSPPCFLFGQGAKRYKTQIDAFTAAGAAVMAEVTTAHPPGGRLNEQNVTAASTNTEEDDIRNSYDDDNIESERLLEAFSQENRLADFNWDNVYGQGFDILNITL